MSVFRKMLRSLLDRELGVLGGELEKLQDQFEDQALKLQAFAVRFERLRSRVGMRQLRAERGELTPAGEFEQLVSRERGRGHGVQEADLGGDDDWTDFRRIQ